MKGEINKQKNKNKIKKMNIYKIITNKLYINRMFKLKNLIFKGKIKMIEEVLYK